MSDVVSSDLDLLVANKYDPLKMVKTGEGFFSSLGFAPLPETFWQRSQIPRPRAREVVCHASAWNLDNKDDTIARAACRERVWHYVSVSVVAGSLKQKRKDSRSQRSI